MGLVSVADAAGCRSTLGHFVGLKPAMQIVNSCTAAVFGKEPT